MRGGRVLRLALSLLAFVSHARAAAPTLESLFPAGGQRGTEVNVTLGGTFTPWPVKFWADSAGIAFDANAKSNGVVKVRIAADAPIGPHLVRVFNESGASIPRWFIVTSHREVNEQEPNNGFKQAQIIGKLPVVINGRLLERGDTDFFTIEAQAGHWLVARVDAYSLGSPVDATLHLFDNQGVRIAFNHDSAQSLDPFLAYRVEKAGTYTFEVAGFVHPPAADVQFAGGKSTIYRLSITDGEFIEGIFPASNPHQGAATQKIGWNIATNGGNTLPTFSANTSGANAKTVPINGGVSQLVIPVTDVAEINEVEPNDTTTNAQPVTLPVVINGRIGKPGDEDRFAFAAKKGDNFEFNAQSSSLGFPLATALRVLNSDGEQLAKADDAEASADAQLSWRAPKDGSYFVSVADLFRKGGDDFVYRLCAGPQRGDFTLTVADHTFRLEPGKTNNVNCTLTRSGNFTNKLNVSLKGLPDGVTAKIGEIPAKNGDIAISLGATTNAPPANQPLRILATATDSANPMRRAATYDLRAKDPPRGPRVISETDQLWITVVPKGVTAEAPKNPTKKKKGTAQP